MSKQQTGSQRGQALVLARVPPPEFTLDSMETPGQAPISALVILLLPATHPPQSFRPSFSLNTAPGSGYWPLPPCWQIAAR